MLTTTTPQPRSPLGVSAKLIFRWRGRHFGHGRQSKRITYDLRQRTPIDEGVPEEVLEGAPLRPAGPSERTFWRTSRHSLDTVTLLVNAKPSVLYSAASPGGLDRCRARPPGDHLKSIPDRAGGPEICFCVVAFQG